MDLIVSFDDHHFLSSSVRTRPLLFSVSWPERRGRKLPVQFLAQMLFWPGMLFIFPVHVLVRIDWIRNRVKDQGRFILS